MNNVYKASQNMSLAEPHPPFISKGQKIYATIGGMGLLILLVALFDMFGSNAAILLWSSLLLMAVGAVMYAWEAYKNLPPGIKNNGIWFSSLTNKGLWGWMLGIVLTGFYILLYFYPSVLGLGAEGESNSGLIAFFDPLSKMLSGNPASQWFVYGALYTLAIVVFGIKFWWKYRHNSYQKLRTLSVMFFQLIFAFTLPEILMRLNQPYFDFKHIWPLNYYAFFEWRIDELIANGQFGIFLLFWSVALILIITPILTYFYGKRWYCSWVCGCGGLAETAGDPFRHLSDKSLKAWRIERWLIHAVLVFVVIMTLGVLFPFLKNSGDTVFNAFNLNVFTTLFFGALAAWLWMDKQRFESVDPKVKMAATGVAVLIVAVIWQAFMVGRQDVFWIPSYQLSKTYGFLIGAVFSGVIGVGFYPLMGSRVWCRFGCPMAAILGLQQRFFSRFRITTNGGQCISCGNCSVYCEMGIDVRSYAQRGQNIVRASCVGCGICSAVCPRGVLKLENGNPKGRTKKLKAFVIGEA